MIIGIDPGKNGGIAWGMRSNSLKCVKMPASVADLASTFRDILKDAKATSLHTPKAYLEKVGAMPKQGVTSTFTFGEGYGQIQGVLAALGIPYEFVGPQKWQKTMGCMTKGDKNVSKAKAQQLFPHIPKITHATADALLICEYGRRRELEINPPSA